MANSNPSQIELSDWLKQAGETQKTFAKKLGISPNYFSQILNGSRGCKLEIAVRIERLTDKAIPCDYWVRDIEDMPPPVEMSHTATTETTEQTETEVHD